MGAEGARCMTTNIRFKASVKRIRMVPTVIGSMGEAEGVFMDRVQIRQDDIPTVKFVLVEGAAADLASATYAFTLDDQAGANVFAVADAKFTKTTLAGSGYITMALIAADTNTAVDGANAELNATVGSAIYTVYVGVWDIIADLA